MTSEPLQRADLRALESEIAELDEFAALATSIEQNAKGRALLAALEIGFAKAREFGAAEKAIIFTESRRTSPICCACWPTARSPRHRPVQWLATPMTVSKRYITNG